MNAEQQRLLLQENAALTEQVRELMAHIRANPVAQGPPRAAAASPPPPPPPAAPGRRALILATVRSAAPRPTLARPARYDRDGVAAARADFCADVVARLQTGAEYPAGTHLSLLGPILSQDEASPAAAATGASAPAEGGEVQRLGCSVPKLLSHQVDAVHIC